MVNPEAAWKPCAVPSAGVVKPWILSDPHIPGGSNNNTEDPHYLDTAYIEVSIISKLGFILLQNFMNIMICNWLSKILLITNFMLFESWFHFFFKSITYVAISNIGFADYLTIYIVTQYRIEITRFHCTTFGKWNRNSQMMLTPIASFSHEAHVLKGKWYLRFTLEKFISITRQNVLWFYNCL